MTGLPIQGQARTPSAVSHTLRRLVRRLRSDAHDDEAESLILVDVLMREYGFTRDPLTKDAEAFSDDLRALVAEWIAPNTKAEGLR